MSKICANYKKRFYIQYSYDNDVVISNIETIELICIVKNRLFDVRINETKNERNTQIYDKYNIY